MKRHFAPAPWSFRSLAKIYPGGNTLLTKTHAMDHDQPKNTQDAQTPDQTPLPQDRRFAAPEWQRWPFNLIYQSFLLNQRWWHQAATAMPGATAHQRQVADFAASQVLDLFSPSNFPLTNPEVVAETVKTGGVNLLKGAQKVIDHYGIMGPVTAALEATVRYLAAELGPAGIRVHAVSPGPIKTRAASGIGDFEQLLDEAASRAPQHQLVTIADVGAVTSMLCSDAARALTGNVIFVDAGYHVMG